MSSLPPTFTSLYRLFLRTASASVLHHKLATRNLRQLWRPAFADAVHTLRKLEKAGIEGNVPECRELQEWLGGWEKRMDSTLSLLYNSAASRGLPHQLTRNLSFIVLSEHQRLRRQASQLPVWNPRLPYDSREYQVRKSTAKENAKQRWKEFSDDAWKSLGEVVRMAEGRDNISLGRIMIKGRIIRRERS
ncbi:hypothetical protein E1B28_012463 [Marasmius oreades]|uniref:Uncharacterized protein n=1 Tax=Marasmius oreades TaxID=181124 RepID=A0A9P7UQT7_9AGAR|nr:uncharacterized protein E1B28_012463 [Marasmius oreades]KAG7088474.1 hypothetical protein E1B28_012463 [Marasmius oreades]